LVLQAEDGGTAAGQFQGFFGEIDGGDLSAATGEIDGIGADAAADFEHFLAAPTIELGESGDVRLDEVLAGFDFVKVLPGADRRGRMADVAGTAIPVLLHPGNLRVREVHDWSRANDRDSFAPIAQITPKE
jgi:hypothetical protein